MTDRRQFLQAGVAVSVASVALHALPAYATSGTHPAVLRLTHFVFDNRFAEAVAMARSIGSRVPLAETRGDLTDLWFHHLHPLWKRAPAAFAGITTQQGLFVLETLAADHRMRVIQRTEHAVRRGQPLVSWIIAPRTTTTRNA